MWLPKKKGGVGILKGEHGHGHGEGVDEYVLTRKEGRLLELQSQ